VKIRSKIFIAFALIFVLAIYFIVRAVDRELLPRYKQPVEDTVVDASNILAVTLANGASNGDRLDAQKVSRLFSAEKHLKKIQIYDKTKTEQEFVIYVTDPHGRVLYHSQDPTAVGADFSRWNDVYRTLKGDYGARSTRLDPKDPFSTTMYVAAPIFINNHLAGVISVGKPISSFHGFIMSAKWRLYSSVLLIIASSLVVLLLLSWILVRPIENLQNYILSLATPQPMAPPSSNTREIHHLTEAFLSLKEKLDAKEYVEDYVNQLTHEIKSPISAIYGAAEILQNPETSETARRQLSNNIHMESKRLQQIAEQLLELASLEKRSRPLNKESFDLNLVVHEILDSLQIAIDKKNLKTVFDGQQEMPVYAERFLMWRALANLIQNAIDFSPREGRLQITTFNEGPIHTIRIQDEGPGIDEAVRPRVFERFFSTERPDTKRKGTGLGLVFTKEVIEQHGGTIQLINTQPHGCQVEVKIT
jgi:two-component system sensor histidine kinase CreC